MFFNRKETQQQSFLCNNSGNCCDCVAFHQVYGGLPVCFVTQSAKTLSEQRLEEEIERLKVIASDKEETIEEIQHAEEPYLQDVEVVEPRKEPVHLKIVVEQEEDNSEDSIRQNVSFLSLNEAEDSSDTDEVDTECVEIVNKMNEKELRDNLIESEKARLAELKAKEEEEKQRVEQERLEIARKKQEEAELAIEQVIEIEHQESETSDGGEIVEIAKENANLPKEEEPPVFIEVFFRCCCVYGKLYLNIQKTHYIGKCPKCKAKLTAPYGESPRFGLRQ
jgi:E3 ubiquitin-protein ligase DOA10